VYGLAFAYMELGDMEPAQKHFKKVLEMEAPDELRGLARNGLRKIAARELKARGPRMDIGVDLGEEWEMAERLGVEWGE
jgi:hypothetical protein